MRMTDDQVIHGLKTGNYTPAVKALYRYYPVVRQMVLKNSGSKQDAEDVYQEALIILFRKAKETDFQLSSKLDTFLFSICRYYWLAELRKRKKEVSSDLEQAIDQPELVQSLIEEELQFVQAEKSILQLGEKCRDLLRLFYFEKLDFRAIASKLGFSNEKVAKNQKYRCLEKAREHFLSSNA
jgi:RNA polymerase sigma factor (sigma-70 family)